VNDTGDWVLAVGLPVFVFLETGSGTSTATLFAFQFAANGLLGPIGGSLVDRWNLRLCLIATNLAQATMLLPLLAVTADRIWPAFVVMSAQAALVQLNNPASIALVPRLVEGEALQSANAAMAAGTNFARLAGAALGGFAVAWGDLAPIVVIDATSFVAAAVALNFLAADTGPAGVESPGEAGVLAGLRAIRRHRPLPQLLVLQGLSQIAQGAFIVLFVVFVVDTLGDDGVGVGIIRGSMAVGAVVGAALIGRLSNRTDPTVLYGAGLIGMGAISFVVWNTPEITTSLWVYVALFSLSGLPGAALAVGLFTTIQTRGPDYALGRVIGFMGALEALGAAGGAIAAGVLVDRAPLQVLLNGQAAIYVFSGMLAFIFVVPHRLKADSDHLAVPLESVMQTPI